MAERQERRRRHTEGNEFLRRFDEGDREARQAKRLDKLPPDPAGKVKALEKHEFINPDAQRKFLELLNQLRRAMTQTFFNDIERMVKEMSAGDIARMKQMLKALNEMLVKKIAGREPGFEDFMAKFGDMFGDNPPQSLDELLERMRQQMAAMQSLLASLKRNSASSCSRCMSDKFGDPELEAELRKLAKEMEFLNPDRQSLQIPRRRGDRPRSGDALMNEMHQLDGHERPGAARRTAATSIRSTRGSSKSCSARTQRIRSTS